MVDQKVRTAVPDEVIQQFKASLRGQLMLPEDDDYDTVRRVWNHNIDKRPALIVRCAGVADILNSVNFARDHNLLVAVRGGGHNVAGNAVCDGGLMIDLSPMKGMRVDPVGRTARAEPGLIGREFDQETQAFGLATTLGTVSDTGIAGLTLGGGFGWLMRKYGLACDNLISVDVVTADGRLVTASTQENSDLFWGVRGGSGNFGIVTSFEYRLHPIGKVLAGMVIHPYSRAKEVLQFHQRFTSAAPEELTTYCILMHLPDGAPACAMLSCYHGDLEEGERVVKPLREFGPPIDDQMKPMDYTFLQTMLDAGFTPGLQFYMKAGLMNEVSDDAIDTLLANYEKAPSKRNVVAVEHLGGAINRVGEDETAFVHRNTRYDLELISVWEHDSEADSNIRWTRQFWQNMGPFFSGGVYVNYLTNDEKERIANAYGPSYERLVALKNKYDPANLFRLNQNIKPTV